MLIVIDEWKQESDDDISFDISENSDIPSHYLCEPKQCAANNISDDDDDDCSSQDSEVSSHYLREAVHCFLGPHNTLLCV